MELKRHRIMNRDAENKTYTMVTIIRMKGRKIFVNTNQSTKSVYKGQVHGRAGINLVPTLTNRIKQ